MAQRELDLKESSHIQSARYDPDTQELTIYFAGGNHGSYMGVPEHDADAFERAQSHGQYLHNYLKPLYPYRKG